MNPASHEEIDHIINELLGDDGPPLLVANDTGDVRVAGTSVPGSHWGRWAKGANNRREAEQRWEENRRQIDQAWKNRVGFGMTSDTPERRAGDVFHGDLERMALREAAARAVKAVSEAERKVRAEQAIHKAVHGE